MNKLVRQILKKSGISAKVTNDSEKPKFRIRDNSLTLEGIVTRRNYTMKITDPSGNIIDELKVNIKDGNDIANRINESVSTLKKLSPIYDNQQRLKEDEEFEEIPETETDDPMDALMDICDNLIATADNTRQITDYFDDYDVESQQFVIEVMGSIYDIAIDISEFVEKHTETPDDANESLLKPVCTEKMATKRAISSLSTVEALLKKHSKFKDITKAVKDIKSELCIRGASK